MKAVFLGKRWQMDDVFSFDFSLPEADWTAGQSIKLEVRAGRRPHERRFTISAAPFEKQITITTRVSDSEFKQALSSLVPGDEINAFSIEGDFVWQKTDEKLLFCASGIGVTPFFAMAKQRAHEQKPLDATLIYAARPGKFLFAEEFEKLQRQHREFQVVFLPARLSVGEIQKICPDFAKMLVYLSGPSKMVDEISPQLLAAGLPGTQLKRDWFTGRADWEQIAGDSS